ncbi:hypothetical protein [uncultured Desulfosarcina sp.]|uniref:hypothetical protein n=1 Tax=uncultured Desulfosarcina sp. TaxID=218289 RepID=UPI0029C95573|nr:hypothetical protein [uncultured Desulfosarcina sp.]
MSSGNGENNVIDIQPANFTNSSTRQAFSFAFVLMIICGTIVLSLYHLSDELWQDEVYTLLQFASKGPAYPFFDYHLPNNHILFSALLAKWWTPGSSVEYLRALPLLLFALAMVVYTASVINLGGRIAGIASLIMFAGSTVTENFALQLRGYAPSWLPIIAAMTALPRYMQSGNWTWAMVYVCASAVSVAILPTNLIFCGIFVVWGWLLILLDRKSDLYRRGGQLLIISIGPLLGFVAYSNVLTNLINHSQRKISNWNPLYLAIHWFWAVSADFILLIPFIGLGIIIAARSTFKQPDFSVGRPANNLALLAATITTLALWLCILPNPPFPRNLVPFLPVWYYLCGYFFSVGWKHFLANNTKLNHVLFLPFIGSVYLLAVLTPNCFGIKGNKEFPQDLCTQYYHEAFYPTRTVQLLNDIIGDRQIPVMTDYDGIYCLGYVIKNSSDIDISLVHYISWKNSKHLSASPPRIIVTRSVAELQKMLNKTGVTADRYVEIANTGFFKIYSDSFMPSELGS